MGTTTAALVLVAALLSGCGDDRGEAAMKAISTFCNEPITKVQRLDLSLRPELSQATCSDGREIRF